MSAAHTPGPWQAVRWADDEEWRIMGTTSTGLEGCYSVAEVFDGNGTPQNTANATLIAAAPDMKEALHAADEALGLLLHDAPTGEFSLMRVAWDAVRAAIARATGAAQ